MVTVILYLFSARSSAACQADTSPTVWHHPLCRPQQWSRLQAYPLDLVRTRLAAQTSSNYYHGIAGTLSTIVRDEGFAGLYRGLGATLLQVAPSLAVNYCAYETLRSLWMQQTHNDGSPPVRRSWILQLLIKTILAGCQVCPTTPGELQSLSYCYHLRFNCVNKVWKQLPGMQCMQWSDLLPVLL